MENDQELYFSVESQTYLSILINICNLGKLFLASISPPIKKPHSKTKTRYSGYIIYLLGHRRSCDLLMMQIERKLLENATSNDQSRMLQQIPSSNEIIHTLNLKSFISFLTAKGAVLN